jgi:hypothetical protein
MISLKPESPEELRKRLRDMSDLELHRFGNDIADRSSGGKEEKSEIRIPSRSRAGRSSSRRRSWISSTSRRTSWRMRCIESQRTGHRRLLLERRWPPAFADQRRAP